MRCNISIGILAYNEVETLESTLQSFLGQSLFTTPMSEMTIEIVVVPNGCTDDTAGVARATLQASTQLSSCSNITWKICEIEQPGLANAWNRFIHDFSAPEADYLFVASADIHFFEAQTLSSMIEILEEMPYALVSVDKRVKDITLREVKGFKDYLSSAVSKLSGAGKEIPGEPAWISGQLSCTRAQILRRIWMPTTLPTDDSFLYTMIVTDGLKQQAEPKRVVLAPNAVHIFEAYTSISKLFRHEKWLIFGQTVNELLYADLSKYRNEETHVCDLVKQRNAQDPSWLNQLVKDAVQSKRWLIPSFILIRRFKSLSDKNFYGKIKFFPLALFAFAVDFVLAIQVNAELRKKGSFNNWAVSGGWGK
jgi:glycosyltransferase involved in cell wall biosynthesis